MADPRLVGAADSILERLKAERTAVAAELADLDLQIELIEVARAVVGGLAAPAAAVARPIEDSPPGKTPASGPVRAPAATGAGAAKAEACPPDAPAPEPRAEAEPSPEFDRPDPVSSASRRRLPAGALRERVIAALSDGPLTGTEIIDRIGGVTTRGSLDQSLGVMVKAGGLLRSGGRPALYDLPARLAGQPSPRPAATPTPSTKPLPTRILDVLALEPEGLTTADVAEILEVPPAKVGAALMALFEARSVQRRWVEADDKVVWTAPRAAGADPPPPERTPAPPARPAPHAAPPPERRPQPRPTAPAPPPPAGTLRDRILTALADGRARNTCSLASACDAKEMDVCMALSSLKQDGRVAARPAAPGGIRPFEWRLAEATADA